MSLLLAAELPEVGAATGAAGLAWLLVALPAAGALVLFLAGRRADAWGHSSACSRSSPSFVIGLLIFVQTLGLEPAARTREQSLYDWISVAGLHVDFGLRIDPLSLTFVLLITGVGGLIHIYAVGYMAPHGDRLRDRRPVGRRRFFAQFNLFITAMLLLVLGNNFVLLYLGWEGVGLASYLLIGFYQGRPSAATAAKKAFLMNRVGDVGLAIAIFILWTQLGTLQYTEVFENVGRIDPNALVAITLLLLLGACGKSGQFPLQAWLPDAMEGPTPVSALIHAATMVTAGVYLDRPHEPDLRPARRRARSSSRSSARSRCSSARSSAAPTTTSRRCWPTPRSARSATCSSRSGSARSATRWASPTCWPTASSRRACSSGPVRSCTR